MKRLIPLLLLVATGAVGHAEGSETHRQRLTGPLIPELLEKHKDLTYEGLRVELPPAPVRLENLDFDPTEARYFDLIRHELALTDEEVGIFREQGFVSTDHQRHYSFTTAYHDIYTSDLPVLITTDSILYALYDSHEEILKEMEMRWFTVTLQDVLRGAHDALAAMAAQDPRERWVANYQDVDVYLTVARHLLEGAGAENATPEQVAAVERAVVAMQSKLGQDAVVKTHLEDIASLKIQNPIADSPTPIYGGTRYMDFSQYRPRGHYTESEWLRRYFRAMMWLSRADTGWNVLPVDSSTGFVCDDRRELANAVLFVELLRTTGGLERLRDVDRLISLLVGSSDSLSAFGLADLMDDAGIRSIRDLAGEGRLEALQAAIRNSEAARQEIRSQVVVSDRGDPHRVSPPATFQLMGQRFAIDSYVLSHLVFDSIVYEERKQMRMMPTGLDVMAAFGNESALSLLEDELRQWNYSANLLAGRKFVEQQRPSFWDQNLYSTWLDALRELDADLGREANAPQVMKTEAWQRKQLQTQLASWSQLRHNTVLYTKQSFTAGYSCEYLDGYVEPYPGFYRALGGFAERAHGLIEGATFTSEDKNRVNAIEQTKRRQLQFFSNMATRMGQLEELARKELAGEPFTEEEREFVRATINRYGSAPLGSGSSPAYYGWYTELFYADQPRPGAFGGGYGGLSQFSAPKSREEAIERMIHGTVRYGRADMFFDPTVTDVHTDPMSKQALQVGIGPVNLCVIAVDHEGDVVSFVGPVFSYHEFHGSASKRLTDEEWAQMLHEGKQPARPDWVRSFVATPVERPKKGPFTSSSRVQSQVLMRVAGGVARPPLDVGQEPFSGQPSVPTFSVTDEGLVGIERYRSLRGLDLSKSPLTDAGLKPLAGLPELRNLSLNETRIDGSGLKVLRNAKWLRRLLLANTQVDDEILPELAKHPHLEILDLSGTPVTGVAVETLRTMHNLRELTVTNTALDAKAVETLREALPKCRIVD